MYPLLLLALALPAAAQTSDTSTQTLLAEVRQLRLTLERSTIVLSKANVVLQRIYFQQMEVSSLSGQLESVRTMLAQPAFDESIPPPDPNLPAEHKRVMEEQVKRMRERYEQEWATQRAREVELAGKLHRERAKLDELHQRLDSLDKVFGDPPPLR